jgi:hypothetical protein
MNIEQVRSGWINRCAGELMALARVHPDGARLLAAELWAEMPDRGIADPVISAHVELDHNERWHIMREAEPAVRPIEER